ncbi:MAG: HD domain-containing protein [Myxococcaceae bacterium]
MELIEQHPFLEQMLEEWAPALGSARVAYGGHAYRVLNYSRALLGSARHDEELALAAAFHDLGIWSDRTFDYLPPSVERAEAFRRERAPGLGAELIAKLIRNHHVLRPLRTGPDPAVQEAFRRADLVDVSRGQLRAGLPPRLVREVVERFPYAGFHGVLVRTAFAWAVRHPLRPLPMVRLR